MIIAEQQEQKSTWKLAPARRLTDDFDGGRGWIFGLLIVLYTGLRLYRLDAVCLDGDEIFSVQIAAKDWAEMIRAAADDSVHPPLFYCLLKLWLIPGFDSLFFLRLLPALFSVLSLLPLFLIGQRMRLGRVETACVLGIASLHPLLIFYSQHVRMYSLLFLIGVSSMWLFHASVTPALASRTAYAALACANTLLAYTHYYGWVLIGLQFFYVCVLRRAHVLHALVSTAAVFFASVPWLYMAAKHSVDKGGLASNLDWIARPGVLDLVWLYYDISGVADIQLVHPRWGVFLFALLLTAITFALRSRMEKFQHAIHLGFFLIGAPLFAWIASLALPNSIWGDRHLIFLVAPVLLLAVKCCFRLRHPLVRVVLAAGLVLWAVLGLRVQWKGNKKTSYDKLVLHLLAEEKDTKGPVPVYSVGRYIHYPLWFYVTVLSKQKSTGISVALEDRKRQAFAAVAARVEIRGNTPLADARGSHFWVAYSSSGAHATPPEFEIANRGCRTGERVSARDEFHVVTLFPVWCHP